MEDVPIEVAENTADNGRDAQGRFTQGNPGRPPMSQNKIAQVIRQRFGEFLLSKLDDLEIIYHELSAREKAKLLTELKGFWVPKLREIVKAEEETRTRIDYSKLKDETLRDILANTTIDEGGQE